MAISERSGIAIISALVSQPDVRLQGIVPAAVSLSIGILVVAFTCSKARLWRIYPSPLVFGSPRCFLLHVAGFSSFPDEEDYPSSRLYLRIGCAGASSRRA